MSGLAARNALENATATNASGEAALLAMFDFMAQRLAAGTTGAGTASSAELKAARDSLGLGAGADIASAATLDLTARTGNIVRITGTTTTTAVTLNNGEQVWCYAVAAWPLTYHATNLPLQGGASYTCNPGDFIVFTKDGSGSLGVQIVPKLGQSVTATPAVRQTVLSGPVDSNGFASFGGSTGSTTVTASGTLKATAAAGGDSNYTGSITNPSWTGLSTNGTMYLYLEISSAGAVTTGSTTLNRIEQWGGTYSTINGQHTFNVQEMTMKVGNGSTATQVYRVFVGEVTVAGGVVSAITWYALMGRYEGAYVSTLPGTATAVSLNHNIGSIPENTKLEIKCLTAEYGYSVGDVIDTNSFAYTASAYQPAATWKTSKTCGFTTGLNQSFSSYHRTTGNYVNFTAANWAYRMTAQRGW